MPGAEMSAPNVPHVVHQAEKEEWESSDAAYVLEDETVKRTATWMDVAYHSVTAMVGAGVLGLPAALAQLGWAGGIFFLLFSIWVSWYTYKLLVYMHEVPDLDCKHGNGVRRLDRYDQLAEHVLGPRRGKWALMPFQMAVLVGIAITYTVVGGDNLAAFAASVAPSRPLLGSWAYYTMFGALQLLLSMLPSFNDLRLVSLLGALMSLAYCSIAIAMSATVQPAGVSYSPTAGQRSSTAHVMGVFNALTTVFFAYGGHNVALEIQATIPVGGAHPTSSIPTMMRGVNITYLATAACYFGVSIMGFYAFGSGVADNVLMAFPQGPYHGVVAAANFMVVLHVAAAYQVYTMPVFSLMEARLRRLRGDGGEPGLALKLGLRMLYVVCVTLVGILIPFFGALMGLVGAVAITPTTFTLPALFWLLYKQPARWSRQWAVNWFVVVITAVLGVMGAVGSVYSIVQSWSSFDVFA